jgi:predicted DNA-binding protein
MYMCHKKVRKQVYLTPEQNEELKSLSVMKGVSEASIIREAVDVYLGESKKAATEKDPLAKLLGLGTSKHSDSAGRHDDYLYGEDEK